jgi:hypothetical protein
MGLGFTVWVTGPDDRIVSGVAESIAARLAARHVPVELLDARTPGVEAIAGPNAGACIAFVAGALTRQGASVVVGLPERSRAARERARADLGRMVEVYVRRLGQEAADYEAPLRAEVEITLPEPEAGAGVERTLRTLEVLELLPAAARSAYSADEEREVIRRLKAFGYR